MIRFALAATLIAGLVAPAAARPAPIRTTGEAVLSEAIPGVSLDDAMALATRGDDDCLPTCTTVVVKTVALSNGVRLEIRRATNSGFQSKPYVLAFSSPDGSSVWSTSYTGQFRNPAISLLDNDSGMGKTADEQLLGITIQRAKGVVWIRFRIAFTLTHFNDRRPSSYTTTYDAAIGCRVDASPPRCAEVVPNRYFDGRITFSGATASVRYTDYDDAVHIDTLTLPR